MTDLPSPYPYFGGKAKVAGEIWKRLGDVTVYVEPFLGSGALWLAHPAHYKAIRSAVVNDIDGMIVNFWRAAQHDPEQVAVWADNPAFECDLHARHIWLVKQKQELKDRLEGDPDFYDVKIAGWWVWGMSQWIGSGFCSGRGSWTSVDGVMTKVDTGQGVTRSRSHLGDAGQGVERLNQDLIAYITALSDAYREVRVTCGDWSRVLKPAVAWGLRLKDPTLTGIVLDPPYSHQERDKAIYAEDYDIDGEVRQWALDNGSNPNLRIAYCTYKDADSETRFRDAGWDAHYWKAHGGYANRSNGRGRENKDREVVWFSPYCVKRVRHVQAGLWSEEEE